MTGGGGDRQRSFGQGGLQRGGLFAVSESVRVSESVGVSAAVDTVVCRSVGLGRLRGSRRGLVPIGSERGRKRSAHARGGVQR